MDQSRPHAEATVSLAPRGGRDPWLDNARLVAAVLIVVMHVCGPAMLRTGVLSELWFATWPLRVPLFVLVAGFFSSAEPLRGRRAVAVLRNILGVYLVCDALASALSWLTGGTLSYNPASPPFALWFLLSLFWWRAMLPLLAHVRHLGVIAVAGAIGAGFIEQIGTSFSASRTLAYLPLFILGWYLRRIDVRAVFERAWVRPVAWVLLVAAGSAAVLVSGLVRRREYQMREAFRGDGYLEQLPSAGMRGVLLLIGAAGALALLGVMPRRQIPVVTYLGTGGMYIYVIHALVLGSSGFEETALYREIDTVPEMLGIIVLAVLGAFVLASPPVRWLTRWLIQPRYRWLFRDEVPTTPPLGRSRVDSPAAP